MSELLKRKIGLLQATAINMIDMVGIGPFVTLYMVIRIMNGPWFLYAWLIGAFLAFMDAMVWSELGAAYPMAGGSYNFLKIAYGEKKWGRLFSFLYVWQTCIQAPLVMASAAIGFAEYLNYFYPLEVWQSKMVSGAVVILVVVLLYRKIEAIGRISMIMWISVFAIFGWIIMGALGRGNFLQPILHMNDGLALNQMFVVLLGQASVKTIYSYLGYYNVCHLGGEIKNPERNIPRSMFISVGGIFVLYMALNISVVSVIPWQEARTESYVVSNFIREVSGQGASRVATILVLIVAFSSVFSATLGYSRVPYAAAADGAFFKIFSRLHPTKEFPYVSLLFLGSLGFIFSLLFKMRNVIDAILAMRILVQFVAQTIGLMLLRRKYGSSKLPFRMWLYPLPAILSLLIWQFVFVSTGWYAVWGSIVALIGIVVFYVKRNFEKIPAGPSLPADH
ncbi:MAG TPA: APC family permease [Flavisolibacter sp.]|nr:APC family permease [Flavisolibacter sp.]